MEIEMLRHGHRGAGRHRNHLGKAALPLDTHHALGAAVSAAVLGADIERHNTGGGDAVA